MDARHVWTLLATMVAIAPVACSGSSDGPGPSAGAGADDGGTTPAEAGGTKPGDSTGRADGGGSNTGGGKDAAASNDGAAASNDSAAAKDSSPLSVNTKTALSTVAGRKIYFAHNSVGGNILGGLEALANDYGVTLRRDMASDASTFDTPVFADGPVDTNGDPLAKIHDFEANRMPAVGTGPSYAFFKLCFVDFDNGTDTQAVAGAYVDSAARLKQAYPSTTFVHFTVPVCKTGDVMNTKRNEYSESIRAAFQGSAALFDLAMLESTHADGTKVTYTDGGKTYPALAEEWADSDGCHLNSDGAKMMAEALVKLLASLP